MYEPMTDRQGSQNACKNGSEQELPEGCIPTGRELESEPVLPAEHTQSEPTPTERKTPPGRKTPAGCKYGTGFFGGKFLPFHRGHLDCILRCASECEKLYVVLMHNSDEEHQILADYKGPFPIEQLSAHTRELALRAELAPFGNIQVIAYDCSEPDARAAREGKHPWFYECQDMVELMGRFDVAYSGEPEYSENFRSFYPWADTVTFDRHRSRRPISATAIRSMPFYEAYGHLPREYQILVNKKVLFTGPESCGKSTLVRKLAAALNTSFTQEQGKLACERVNLSSPGAEQY
ncbi:MAG: adenylyltransferase/cytidyltransferase family protein, partial [Eggerthellaceae bacterium]|nr:adenylyltransferase/cytidyltransferase family protein [Eggerthellaceae bacterium]